MKIIIFTILFMSLCQLPDYTTPKLLARKKRELLAFKDVIRIIPYSISIGKNVYKLWDFLLKNPNANIESAFFKNKELEIYGQLSEVLTQLKNLELTVNQAAEATISNILQGLPNVLKLELNLHDMRKVINQINFANDLLNNYLFLGYKNTSENIKHIPDMDQEFYNTAYQNKSFYIETANSINKRNLTVEKFTIETFAIWATNQEPTSLMSLLRRMNDLVINDGVFNLVLSSAQVAKSNICELKQSPFQVLYNLYNTITIAELKGNTILQFSYMILRMYNKGNFTAEAQLALSMYQKYASEKAEAIRRALSEADRSIYKCDPKQYVKDVTYTQLTKLLQGYVENEVNLNPYRTCRENCQYYQYTEYNGCFKNQFCANQPPCKGKVINCRYVDSDMNICTSNSPERRYDWVEYENGKTLGSPGVCEKKNLFKVDSWWRYLFWHCSYCLCLCDDTDDESDRYFNLRDVTSDIEENKILTGVRLIKQNKIIHIQIQQGVLTPLGVVNKTSLSWKPVDNYKIDDQNVDNNVDYHTMSWLERAIDTDRVFGPPEHVVTGVRFRKISTHLNLEVRVTPINFTSGEVYKAHHSYWLGNDNTDASKQNPRTEIELTDPDIPIRKGPHNLNSKPDQFIQFQPTSFETDAGQNTVPYIDSQALTSQGFPLSGLGLIHKGKKKSGGFLALELVSYDFLPHIGVFDNSK